MVFSIKYSSILNTYLMCNQLYNFETLISTKLYACLCIIKLTSDLVNIGHSKNKPKPTVNP